MTFDEFKLWVKHHRSCFFGMGAWLDKIPKPGKEKPGTPNQNDVMQRWFNTLKAVDLETAKRMSDQMHCGEIDEPVGYDRHPLTIRRAALHHVDSVVYHRNQYVDGERTYKCGLCCDDGWVTVWHPKAMNAVLNRTFGQPGTVTTIVVACSCQAGESHANANALRFDDQIMLPLDGYKHHQKEQEKLFYFMNTITTYEHGAI